MRFSQQLKLSQKQEKVLAKILANYFKCDVIVESSSPFFDGVIYFPEGPKTYEFKDERKYGLSTGNHFVEIESWGRNSGILITKADYWVLQMTNSLVYMIPTPVLRRGIFDNQKSWKIVKGGDIKDGVKTSIGILVSLKWIQDHPETITINLKKK